MKTLGLIGGTSWVSTVDYYKTINHLTNERLGGLSSAKILLYSINLDEFKNLVDTNKWGEIGNMFSNVAKRLEHAGAECILLCANTLHMVAETVQQHIAIPLLHIAEMTAQEIVKQKIDTVGLLGTKFTMEKPFFKERLDKYNIQTFIPNDADRDFIHSSIFTELVKGIFRDETKKKYIEIIEDLKSKGARGIILGCTEFPLLIRPEECDVPIFDTTAIHCKSAVDFALGDERMNN